MSDSPRTPVPAPHTLAAPILPLSFIAGVFVERSIVAVRAWLAQNAPTHVQAAQSAIEFGYECLLAAAKNNGQITQGLNDSLDECTPLWLRGIHDTAAEVGAPLELGE